MDAASLLQGASTHPLLGFVDMQHVHSMVREGFVYSYAHAMEKDPAYTLFRYEDWPAWVIFTTVFITLILFDNLVLHRNPAAMTTTKAIVYTLFWIVMAAGFCCWVGFYFGRDAAYMWWSGYLLEWMLSFDNLFVFHLIFQSYACPDHLKHRPLFFGIVGAVLMRLVFIFAGQYLMHAMSFMHLIFGGFLIYSGIMTVYADEEEDDPSQTPIVLWLQSWFKLVSVYDSKGAFFVQCPIDQHGDPDIPDNCIVKDFAYLSENSDETTPLVEEAPDSPREWHVSKGASRKVDVVDFSKVARQASQRGQRFETRGTMLFLVCVCLNLCDLLFAVDSVSAIVAAVNDLFLAYTSAVFAMLGMRAIFFLITIMVHLFALLKYGVAFILVFIGVKLIVGTYYHISSVLVCGVLVGALGTSVVASIVMDKLHPDAEDCRAPSDCCKDRKPDKAQESPAEPRTAQESAEKPRRAQTKS